MLHVFNQSNKAWRKDWEIINPWWNKGICIRIRWIGQHYQSRLWNNQSFKISFDRLIATYQNDTILKIDNCQLVWKTSIIYLCLTTKNFWLSRNPKKIFSNLKYDVESLYPIRYSDKSLQYLWKAKTIRNISQWELKQFK